MPLTLKYRAIEWLARLFMPSEGQSLEAQRRSLVDAAQPGIITGPKLAVDQAIDTVIAGVPVRRYRPHNSLPGTLVFFHGGGWIVGDADSHDLLTRALASATRRDVVSVNYRRPPENPFPAAFDDCRAVALACVDAGGRVVVTGDSAGGNLAAAVAISLPPGTLAAQVLIYPVTDLTTEMPSYSTWGSSVMCTASEMRTSIAAYVPDAGARSSPACSPLHAPGAVLAAAPPAYVLLAECDPLHDEGAAYYDALLKSSITDGGSLSLHAPLDDVRGVPHGFMSMLGMHEARAALARIAAWLEDRWVAQ